MELVNETATLILDMPGSKSLSHRYLIGAALAKGETRLRNCQKSDDIFVTRRLLEQLGASCTEIDEETLLVRGIAGQILGGKGSPMDCNVGESGTSCRLLSAVFAAGRGLFRIHGEGRMHNRPVLDLCNALTRLGAGICYTEKNGYPPVLLQAHGLDPDLVKGELAIGMDASSQYFSGLLLAAPLASKSLILELGGKKAVSWPYVGLTLACLQDYGIEFSVATRPNALSNWTVLSHNRWREVALVEPGCLRIEVQPGTYRPGIFTIEADWSAASYFLAAAVLGKRAVTIRGLREDSLQGDRIFLEILIKMGGHVECHDGGVTVFPSALHGVDLDMGTCPDLVPTVCMLAAFAHGSTRIRNVAHLRLKETDRIQAPATELGRIGVIVDTLSDGLLISGKGDHVRPRKQQTHLLKAGEMLSTHNDHRMAMALALLDLVDPGLHVYEHLDNPHCVTKSFPTFWALWDTVTQPSSSL